METPGSLKKLFRYFYSDGEFDISGLSDVNEILDAAQARYDVVLCRLLMASLDGEVWTDSANTRLYFDQPSMKEIRPSRYVGLPESYQCVSGDARGVVRIDPDGRAMSFGIVGSQYAVIQNAHLVSGALKLVEDADGELVGLKCAGTYDGGRKFYISSQATALTVDIGAYSEHFHRSVEYGTSHDSELGHYTLFLFSDPHTGCVLEHVLVKKRHTRRVWDAVSESQDALKQLRETSDALVKDVQQLAGIQLPPDSPRFRAMLADCAESVCSRIRDFSSDDLEDATASIKKLFLENHRNRRGSNLWALYTAYLEVDDQVLMSELSRKRSVPSLHQSSITTQTYGDIRRKTRSKLLKAGNP